VMIHSQHTTITDSAVMSAIGLVLCATPLAKPPLAGLLRLKSRLDLNWLFSIVLLNILPIRSIRDRPWRGYYRQNQADNHHYREYIEDDRMTQAHLE
jgi:hypothetical protein